MGVPFQEEVDVSNYFPGAEFEKTLSGIESALGGESSLIILSGPEGTGKSMLCHLICTQEGVRSVYFPRPVEAFGEVVATIAVELGILGDLDAAGARPEDTIARIVDALKSTGEPVLLVFDEAENIYPATLERIRRMGDQLLREGCRLHTLFSGRPAFIDSCNQSYAADFEKVREFFYELAPLGEDEVAAYIYSVVEKQLSPRGTAREIFTLEKVAKICAASHGNLRAVNRLAREAMSGGGDDSAFVTLLETVEEEVVGQSEEPGVVDVVDDGGPGVRNPWFDQLQKYRRPLLVALLLVGVPVAGWLFFSGGEEPAVVPEKPAAPTRVSGEEAEEAFVRAEEAALHQPLDRGEPSVALSTVTEEKTAVNTESDEGEKQPEENGEGQQGEQSSAPQEESLAKAPAAANDGLGQGEEESLDDSRELSPPSPPPGRVISPLHRKKMFAVAARAAGGGEGARSQPVVSPAAPKVVKTNDSAELPVLRPSGREKRRVASSSPVNSRVTAVNRPRSAEEMRIERLLQNRLVAGMGWQRGTRNRLYTVQLMVLNSDAAMANLKRMLADDKHRYLVSDLYLFSKGVNPERLMVFYGEFPTVDEANRALRKLPPFLRGYRPRTLSIKDAMRKVHR